VSTSIKTEYDSSLLRPTQHTGHNYVKCHTTIQLENTILYKIITGTVQLSEEATSPNSASVKRQG